MTAGPPVLLRDALHATSRCPTTSGASARPGRHGGGGTVVMPPGAPSREATPSRFSREVARSPCGRAARRGRLRYDGTSRSSGPAVTESECSPYLDKTPRDRKRNQASGSGETLRQFRYSLVGFQWVSSTTGLGGKDHDLPLHHIGIDCQCKAGSGAFPGVIH